MKNKEKTKTKIEVAAAMLTIVGMILIIMSIVIFFGDMPSNKFFIHY